MTELTYLRYLGEIKALSEQATKNIIDSLRDNANLLNNDTKEYIENKSFSTLLQLEFSLFLFIEVNSAIVAKNTPMEEQVKWLQIAHPLLQYLMDTMVYFSFSDVVPS